jgi:hypothetical protein
MWRPLLVIAEVAGGDWPFRVQEALDVLGSTARTDTASEGMRLLADIRHVFYQRGLDRIPSQELAAALMEIEDAPWGDWDGDPTRRLPPLLEPYGIKPKAMKFGNSTLNGYLRKSFEQHWRRLLPEYEPPEGKDPRPSNPAEPTKARGRWSRLLPRAGR